MTLIGPMWTVYTRIARAFLPSILIFAYACDLSGDAESANRLESRPPADIVVWGCESAIPSKVDTLDPRWRDQTVGVGDFLLDRTATLEAAWRRHPRADLELKLPVTIEGHSGATVWITPHERERVGLLLGDVPRRGPGNSYQIKDGYEAVRFEPCIDRKWTSWTAGLALADRRQVVVVVQVEGAPHPESVTIGARAVLVPAQG
jgi:hypothetical protein